MVLGWGRGCSEGLTHCHNVHCRSKMIVYSMTHSYSSWYWIVSTQYYTFFLSLGDNQQSTQTYLQYIFRLDKFFVFENEVLLDGSIQSLVRFGLPHNLLETDLPRPQPQLAGHCVLRGGAGPAPGRWVALQHRGEAEVLQQVLYLGAQRHCGF